MRLYVSGPMSGLPEHNFPAFNKAEKQLLSAGYEVENPATKGIIEGWSWEDYLRYDLQKLLDCDGVALLDGWEYSRGARLETNVAGELGIHTTSVRAWLVIAELRQSEEAEQIEREHLEAIEVAHKAMLSSYIGPPPKLRGDAERMVAALVKHGWGPLS